VEESPQIGALSQAYRDQRMQPVDVVEAIYQRLRQSSDDAAWITIRPEGVLRTEAEALARQSPDRLPLFGIPFAIKDNIDAAGLPTTAAYPGCQLEGGDDAEVVQRLRQAGALLIGKTNMDQFATGLVGVRTPLGTPRNAFSPEHIPGGSSSGSAVVVATGLVSFALGTDTAGSGRVPAAFNNLVGIKPSRGRISTHGVFPACRSLDCISIFALTVSDADVVVDVAEGYDPNDAYARRVQEPDRDRAPSAFRFGHPRRDQLEFYGDEQALRAFDDALERLQALGGDPVPVDLRAFREAASLLYGSPWVAERLAAVEAILATHHEPIEPTLREILARADQYSATETFHAQYRLAELQRDIEPLWDSIDCLVTPTAPTIYTVEAVQNNPMQLNANLGVYTNFANLLDLAAVAVPGPFRGDGLPFGITLLGPAWSDESLMQLGDRFHKALGQSVGALPQQPHASVDRPRPSGPKTVDIAVVGAHLRGEPLNHQLTDRSGYLKWETQTSPGYRLFALTASDPIKPGLIRDDERGDAVDVEVWSLPLSRYGELVSLIPSPLGIGRIELADGTWVQGFLAEAYAVEGAPEITQLGSWRAYRGTG